MDPLSLTPCLVSWTFSASIQCSGIPTCTCSEHLCYVETESMFFLLFPTVLSCLWTWPRSAILLSALPGSNSISFSPQRSPNWNVAKQSKCGAFRELLSDGVAFGPASVSLGKETMFAGRCDLEAEGGGSWEAVCNAIKGQGGNGEIHLFTTKLLI